MKGPKGISKECEDFFATGCQIMQAPEKPGKKSDPTSEGQSTSVLWLPSPVLASMDDEWKTASGKDEVVHGLSSSRLTQILSPLNIQLVSSKMYAEFSLPSF